MADVLETGLRHRLRRALRRVESQHVQMRALLREVEKCASDGDRDAVREPLALLQDALSGHFEMEDQVLFPALHGFSPTARAGLEELSREHREFLADVGDMLASRRACDAAAAARLHAAIGDHERREERLLVEIVGEQDLRRIR